MSEHHAHDARQGGHPVKGHNFHADAAKKGDGSFDLEELKRGAAFWMGQFRDGTYSVKVFTERKVTAKIDCLILVRHKGAGPALYDLGKIGQGVAHWFDQFETGSAKVIGFDEQAIDEDDDLLILFRERA